MTAEEIFSKLLSNAGAIKNNTCDGWIAGNPRKEVKKIGTCFKLTADMIPQAVKEGVDLIITHEPTYSTGDSAVNEIDLKKKNLLDHSDLTVYRFHDHAHSTDPDYIHTGFLQTLDLNILRSYQPECLGVCRYDIAENITTRQLAQRIRDRLGLDCIRIVGKDDIPLKTVCLGLGSVGLPQIKYLFQPGCDLFITGEVGEVCVAEYVRDACFFGENKSVLILGHYSSEYAGMRFLAKQLNKTVTETVFLEGGEVYRRLN